MSDNDTGEEDKAAPPMAANAAAGVAGAAQSKSAADKMLQKISELKSRGCKKSNLSRFPICFLMMYGS